MPPIQIALVPYEGVDPSPKEFLTVAAALQTQATRDVAPAWGVEGIIAPFWKLDDVPPGYFPLLLVNSVAGGHGYHVPGQGLPMAVVQYERETAWSVLASHEMIEMLVDPWGNLTSSAWTPEDGWRQYIVEVCDPCQDVFYLIDDVPVADFVTPDYYDPSNTRDVRYSFTGALRAPLTLTAGGCVSYATPDGSVHQKVGTGRDKPIRVTKTGPLREEIGNAGKVKPLDLAWIGARGTDKARESGSAYAYGLREQVRPYVEDGGSQGEGPGALGLPARELPSQEQRILALLEQLGNPAYTTYDRFKEDPGAVYAEFGIDPLPDKKTLEKFKTDLAPRSHFAKVVRSHRTGTLLGDPNSMDYMKTHAGFFGG